MVIRKFITLIVLLLAAAPVLAATVAVTAPSTTVTKWGIGSEQRIRWEHDLGISATFTIELSRDSGSSWSTLSTSAPSSTATAGNFFWTVTACVVTCPESSVVKVTANDAPNPTDDSVVFSIVDYSVPVVKKPAASEVLATGAPYTIAATHVVGYNQPFSIDLARDGSTFSEQIVAATNSQWVNRVEYVYTFTGTCTSPGVCRIRVTDYLNGQGVSGAFDLQ